MLRARKGERRRIYERKKKALKDLDYRGKKGDGAVGGTKVKGFARLEDGDDVSGFPNGGRLAEFMERLKSFVRKEMPQGPRCFR